MTPFGETPCFHVSDVFAEGREAFLLQATVLGEEIAVRLRMTGRALFVVTEDVVLEKKLRVAAVSGAERHEDQLRL